VEESKRRLTLSLQPTKDRTGFHMGLLDRFYLKDRTSNLWHWDFPRKDSHTLTANMCSRDCDVRGDKNPYTQPVDSYASLTEHKKARGAKTKGKDQSKAIKSLD
jgi:hypothetical protein